MTAFVYPGGINVHCNRCSYDRISTHTHVSGPSSCLHFTIFTLVSFLTHLLSSIWFTKFFRRMVCIQQAACSSFHRLLSSETERFPFIWKRIRHTFRSRNVRSRIFRYNWVRRVNTKFKIVGNFSYGQTTVR